MSDPELTDHAELNALLADPALWAEPDPDLEDLIVREITTEAGKTSAVGPVDADVRNTQSNVVPLPDRSSPSGRSRLARSVIPFAIGIAAGLILAVSALTLRTADDGIELVLAGTDLAPQASASALIEQGPLGVRIKLDVSGLPPSPDGTYYQAWVRKDAEFGVSAGTFHLRGGDGEIELWAGVSTDDYPLITVTVQQEGEGPESSGKVVLAGRLQ